MNYVCVSEYQITRSFGGHTTVANILFIVVVNEESTIIQVNKLK